MTLTKNVLIFIALISLIITIILLSLRKYTTDPVRNPISTSTLNLTNPPPPGGFEVFPSLLLSNYCYIYWDAPITGEADSYLVEAIVPDGFGLQDSRFTIKGRAALYSYNFSSSGELFLQFSIRAVKGSLISQPVIVTNNQNACFPKGSLVAVCTENTTVLKNIEDVCVGDRVIGAFGEINTVLGIQTLSVGTNILFKINGNHITTDHHPHITPEKKFLVLDGISLIKNNLNGNLFSIFDGHQYVLKQLEGLNTTRLNKMKIGDSLKTLYGSKTISSIISVKIDPQEKLYNLVVSGSHTYHVDEFAVTGWPSELDFDYDTWSAKMKI